MHECIHKVSHSQVQDKLMIEDLVTVQSKWHWLIYSSSSQSRGKDMTLMLLVVEVFCTQLDDVPP